MPEEPKLCRICHRSTESSLSGECAPNCKWILLLLFCQSIDSTLCQLQCQCRIGSAGCLCYGCYRKQRDTRRSRRCELCQERLFHIEPSHLIIAMRFCQLFCIIFALSSFIISVISSSGAALAAACCSLIVSVLNGSIACLIASELVKGRFPICWSFSAEFEMSKQTIIDC